MKQSKQSSKAASFARKSPVLASLALACIMATTATNAYAITDSPALVQRAIEFIQNIFREIKMVKSYVDTAKGWKDQFADPSKVFGSAISSLDTYDVSNAPRRSLSYGADRCELGSGGGFSVKDIIGGLTTTGTNYVQKQKQICLKIVTLENAKYNTLLDTLNRIKKAEGDMSKIDNNVTKDDTAGAAGAAVVNAISKSMAVEKLHVEMHTQALLYDSIIATLNQEMTTVAQEAFQGKPKNFAETLLSTGISLTALKTTLNAQKSTCPSGFDCN